MKCVFGVDFGSLSCRAVLFDAETGAELGGRSFAYPHAVMSEALPDGTRLPPDWALQHPGDYLDGLRNTVPVILQETGVDPADVAGIGIDFTACTLLPVDRELMPLCLHDAYASRPHAYVKLWKHHAAQPYADRLNALARERGEAFLSRYGGKISAEWAIPKIWQIADEDEEIYRNTYRFLEAADWIVSVLCGKESHSAPLASYKAMWQEGEGYPRDFLRALDPRLGALPGTKLSEQLSPIGTKAGGIGARGAELTGLLPGTPVAVANIDAHVALPAVKACKPGVLTMIMGTSTCHILCGTEEKTVPGMCGVVRDGAVPGLYAYEAGQSCVGDHFAWFVDRAVPADYRAAAEAAGMNLHAYLREKASRLRPGESGLVALDWWNGNRSVLVDTDLTGVMLGMTLATKPEEMYRALIEATAYGTRMIVDTFEAAGIPVRSLVASGGIAAKDPMMMQIYADVTGRELRLAGSTQTPALGSAIFAALAAGLYGTLEDAAAGMGNLSDTVYTPDPSAVKVYDALYREYRTLHDYFGRGENQVMKRLKKLREESLDENRLR